jgi:hypothetical protein
MFRKLAVVLIAPLLAAAACSDDSKVVAADPISALQGAPDAMAEAGSGRFEMTLTMRVPGLPDGADITGSGEFSGDTMSMELDFGTALASLGEAGESIPEGFDEPMQMVVDGTNLFARVPMLEAITGTAGWLSATPEDVESLGSLGFGTGMDPTKLLEILRGVSDEVEEVGSDEVRGEATTHYRATVDLARALDQVPVEQRAALEKELQGLGDLGDVPVDVWIDGDGLARRVELDMGDVMSGLGAGEGDATMRMEFFDYGEDISVEVPSLDDATPISEVFGNLGAALG